MQSEVYGAPPVLRLRHGTRIYALAMLFAIIALIQWSFLGYFWQLKTFKTERWRYGVWLVCTFFAICALAWTNFGRKFPFNVAIIIFIVETSTIYVAMEQKNTRGLVVNIYASIIVIAIVTASIFWGAYFPMFVVPGDLMLSITFATANIMIAVFFINLFFFDNTTTFYYVRNFFGFLAIVMIMYTATIIHDRQFDVPKNEYLFLSVLLFFCYMILQERFLQLAVLSKST